MADAISPDESREFSEIYDGSPSLQTDGKQVWGAWIDARRWIDGKLDEPLVKATNGKTLLKATGQIARAKELQKLRDEVTEVIDAATDILDQAHTDDGADSGAVYGLVPDGGDKFSIIRPTTTPLVSDPGRQVALPPKGRKGKSFSPFPSASR